jgi:iron uptake system EfeUOB component EfeO/EfeM
MTDSQTLQQMAEQNAKHYKDDERNFSNIEKRAGKHEELMKISGEHLSHLRGDLNITMSEVQEIKKVQEETVKKIDNLTIQIENLTNKFETHSKVVEPILENYHNNEGFWKVVKKWGANSAVFAGLVTAYYIIREIFK